MNLRELEWFVQLAQDENVTRVARELHVTQSTLSRAVVRVEAHFGAQLFDRQGRRLRLNQYGQAVAHHAQIVLEELRRARTHIEEMMDPKSGTVRLGYVPWLGSWLVPEVLRQYRTAAPMVRFTLSSGTPEAILGDLCRGATELLLTSRLPWVEGIACQVLFQAPLYLAVSKRHRLAGRESVSLAELSDEDFIVPGAQSELRRDIDSVCRKSGFTPRVVFDSSHSQPDTIRGFVAAGLGVAIRPVAYEAGDSRVAYIRLTDVGIEREISLAWRADTCLSAVTTEFRNFLLSSPSHLAKPLVHVTA